MIWRLSILLKTSFLQMKTVLPADNFCINSNCTFSENTFMLVVLYQNFIVVLVLHWNFTPLLKVTWSLVGSNVILIFLWTTVVISNIKEHYSFIPSWIRAALECCSYSNLCFLNNRPLLVVFLTLKFDAQLSKMRWCCI